MWAEGRLGSASVSAVAVFIALLLAIGALAALSPTVSQLFSANREGLREGGERGAELVRIYVHSTDETELGEPVITIINSHDRPSILTDYVVVSRRGEVLAAGKVGGSLSGLRLEPGERVDMRPGDLGLSYATFAEMADAVKAIYFRTAEGNSFGSSYGPPPDDDARIIYSFSTTRSYAIEIPSTTTSYSYSINGTFPTLGEALVVKNVILVDRNGIVRGGATNGQRWSDGSFSPSRIMLSGRLSTGPDSVPMGGYYSVPDWWSDSFGPCLDIYKTDDTCPQYIEMVEIHPREYFSPGGSATAQAYYARFAAETQVVWNQLESQTYTVTAQRPVRVENYPYGIPGTYTPTIPATYTSYIATVSRTLVPTRTATYTITSLITSPTRTTTITTTYMTYTTSCGALGCITQWYPTTQTYTSTLYTTRTFVSYSVTYYYTTYTTIVRVGTSTYTTTVTTPVAVWPEGGLVKFAPVFDPYQAYDRRSGGCGVSFGPSGGTNTCSFTINAPSGPLKPIAIKEVGYTVSTSTWGYCNQANKPSVAINYVKVTGPWGTFSLSSGSWSMTDLPFGSVSFELQASMGACYPDWHGSAVITGWVVYEFFWSGPTATATVLASDLGEQVRRAVNGSQLSGDAVASLAGTVQPGQIIKVNAPIILLNYVYFIKTDPTDLPPSPSPSSGGGASYGGRMWCEVTTELRPAPDGGGGPAGSVGGIDVYLPKWLEYKLVRCQPQ
jgi:hypothetical protein